VFIEEVARVEKDPEIVESTYIVPRYKFLSIHILLTVNWIFLIE
jgi:hypothetical protein